MYYRRNRDEIREQQKEYYEDHKEEIKRQRRFGTHFSQKPLETEFKMTEKQIASRLVKLAKVLIAEEDEEV